MEKKLEDIAQMTGVIDYSDVYTLERKAKTDKAFRKEVRAIIGEWEDAAEEDDETTMEECAKKLKALVPAQEA